MKNLSILLIICLTVFTGLTQEPVPSFTKYPVPETGCSYYLPGEPEFELAYSPDSSMVITAEVQVGNFFFYVITIRYGEGLVLEQEEIAPMIEGYLTYLQSTLGITETAGLGWGHTLESNPAAIGAIDYWIDEEGTRFAVKAWGDPHFLSVLALYGDGEYPYFNAQEMFLNGFRFPEKN